MINNGDTRPFDFSLLEQEGGFDSVFHSLSEPAYFRIEYPNCQVLPTLCLLNMDFDVNDFLTNVFRTNIINVFLYNLAKTQQIKYIAFCAPEGALAVRITHEFSSKLSVFVRSISDIPARFNDNFEKEVCEKYFNVRFSSPFICSSSSREYKKQILSFRLFLAVFIALLCFLSISTVFVHHNADVSTFKYLSTNLNGHILLKKDMTLSPCLVDLFRYLKVKDIQSAEEANDYCQKNFLRPKGIERQALKPHPLESQFDKITPIFRKMLMYGQIPAFGHFRYLAFNGQSLYQMRSQVEFIKNSQVTFDEIVFAAGVRKIKAVIEANDPYFGKVTTESEAASLFMKEYFPNHKAQILNASLEAGSKLPRPNTRTTVEAWLKSNPEPGSILMVSTNPYIGYQYLTWYGELKKNDWFKNGGTLLMCGEVNKENKANRLAVMLDNVARTLYTEIENGPI